MTEQRAAPAAEPAPEPADATPATTPPLPAPSAVIPEAAPGPSAFLPMPPLPPLSPSPRPPRRVLRAVARWAVAVLVLGGLGTGTAYAITSAERNDVPGLATESDGRWDYPRLSLPALPSGAPRPFSEGNTAEVHHADLRKLLLPAPAGATPDKKLTGDWVSTERFVAEYEKSSRAGVGEQLRELALRHIAARGWTMPDGTVSRIYLLQFNSTAYAAEFSDDRYVGTTVRDVLLGAPYVGLDEAWSGDGKVENTASHVFSEQKPFGADQVREAYLVSGDTVGLVIQSRRGAEGTQRIPFHQTLILQNQLLG